jgi:hypothetical protein
MQLAESRRGKLSRREKLKGVCLLKLPRLARWAMGPEARRAPEPCGSTMRKPGPPPRVCEPCVSLYPYGAALAACVVWGCCGGPNRPCAPKSHLAACATCLQAAGRMPQKIRPTLRSQNRRVLCGAAALEHRDQGPARPL